MSPPLFPPFLQWQRPLARLPALVHVAGHDDHHVLRRVCDDYPVGTFGVISDNVATTCLGCVTGLRALKGSHA